MTAPLSGYGWSQLVRRFFFGCVVGHIYSPWLKFHGGKGIAVAIGALFFVFGPLFIAVFELVIFACSWSRRAMFPVGSIAARFARPFFAFLFTGPNLPAACAISIAALLVVFAHRENIKRLINHNENRIGSKKKA